MIKKKSETDIANSSFCVKESRVETKEKKISLRQIKATIIIKFSIMKTLLSVIVILVWPISQVNSTKQQQDGSKSCDSYLRKISDFPDGYRAYLKLPILESTNSGWTMKIKYSHKIRNFDTSMGDVRRLPGDREVHLKNRPHLKKLTSPGTFSLDFTIHHLRNVKKSIHIESIEFGSFRCGAGGSGGGGVVKDTCEEFISIIDIDSKHQLFDVRLPILEEETTQPWILEMGWTKPLACFKHNGASTISQQQQWSKFKVVSKNVEILKTDQMFVKRFDVSFKQNQGRSYVNWIKFGKFECRGYNTVQ